MPKFSTPLDVRIKGEQLFTLVLPLVYENKKYTITVYSGFEFNGASIPQALWSIVGCPMGGLYSAAACLHDALYTSKLFDRKTCDKFFYEAMISCGVDKATAIEMYLAVRAFGQSAYDDRTYLPESRNLVNIAIK